MSRKDIETDYAAELEIDFARWDELFTKGGSDPSWADGVNLNLVRSQIIYDRQRLAEQESSLFGLPEVYYRKILPEVDNHYMARPNEICENARKAMEIIDADENLKFVREQFPSLSEQQRKRWCLSAIIKYSENFRQAIVADDLITMRRYEHLESYLNSFENAATKIRNPESTRHVNDNLTICDPEDDEDFEEENSESEQVEEAELSKSASEPEEDFQLRFF